MTPHELDAIDARSAERDKAGAHCVATRETVDLLTAEVRRLRAIEALAVEYAHSYQVTVKHGAMERRTNENVRLVKALALSVGVVLYPARGGAK